MIEDILNRLRRSMGDFATDVNPEQRESALRVISNALDETYLYYRDLKNGMAKSLERERMLVKYWSAAAIPISKFDPELGDLCDLKSEYWTNPDNYTNEEIAQLGIGLDNVRQAYRRLINPRYVVAGKRR